MFYPNISYARTFIECRSLFLIVKAIVWLTGQDNKKSLLSFGLKKYLFRAMFQFSLFFYHFPGGLEIRTQVNEPGNLHGNPICIHPAEIKYAFMTT